MRSKFNYRIVSVCNSCKYSILCGISTIAYVILYFMFQISYFHHLPSSLHFEQFAVFLFFLCHGALTLTPRWCSISNFYRFATKHPLKKVIIKVVLYSGGNGNNHSKYSSYFGCMYKINTHDTKKFVLKPNFHCSLCVRLSHYTLKYCVHKWYFQPSRNIYI